MMRRGGMTYLIAALALLSVMSCVRRPKGVLSDKEMAPVIADMELAESYLQTQFSTNSGSDVRERIIAGVLDKHGISREEFDSTMSWYGHNIDAYYKLDNQVNRELAARRKQITKKGGNAANKSVADLWPYKRTAVIMEQSGSMTMPFSLTETNIKPGSKVLWRMKLRNSADATLLLGIQYANGMITYQSRPISGNKRLEMSLQTDTALKVVRVFGNLAVKRPTELPLWIDSIFLETEPLDTTLYYQMQSQRQLTRPVRPRPVTEPEKSDSIVIDDEPLPGKVTPRPLPAK